MAKNVGGLDRIVRIVAGVGLMAAAMMSNSDFMMNYMVPVGIVGFVLFLTGVFKWCPTYLPFGINTGKK